MPRAMLIVKDILHEVCMPLLARVEGPLKLPHSHCCIQLQHSICTAKFMQLMYHVKLIVASPFVPQHLCCSFHSAPLCQPDRIHTYIHIYIHACIYVCMYWRSIFVQISVKGNDFTFILLLCCLNTARVVWNIFYWHFSSIPCFAVQVCTSLHQACPFSWMMKLNLSAF